MELCSFQHPSPLSAVIRLGRESRRRLDELIPGQFPQGQGGLIAIVQDRVGLHTVRHDDKWRFEQCAGLLFQAACPLDQIVSYPMTIAVQQQLTPLHNAWFVPRLDFHERGRNMSLRSRQASPIGSTQTLAKIANRLAKKLPGTEGVFNLLESDVDTMLDKVDVGDVWGIGRQWAAWLKGQGINTALDLKRADPKRIRARMTVVGEKIVSELNGESCLDLELVAPPQKGITVSRSFGRQLSDRERSGRPSCSSWGGQGRSCAARICRRSA